MNDFEKIEHLLLHKKYEELNSAELKEVKEYFENATDYNDMRDTLMQVKSTLATDKLLIKPSVELKEKLLQQFENTYTNQNEKNNNKKRPFYRTIAFQWSAAASVIILLSISAITYFNNLNKSDKEIAANYKKDNTNLSPAGSDGKVMNNTSETGNNGVPNSGIVSNDVREESMEEEKTNVSSNVQDQQNKSKVYGNISVSEDVIDEKESINIENAPEYYRDNTTIDDNKSKSDEKDLDGLKDKTYELNTTIPVKTVNEKKVNPNKNTTLTKKKKDESINEGNNQGELGGYMSVNQMVTFNKNDSTQVANDSLFKDSNQLEKRTRDAKIELKKAEKDN